MSDKIISLNNTEELCHIKFISDNNTYYNLNLFHIKEGNGREAPQEESLYNITTLKALLELGANSTNIIKEPNKTFAEAIEPNRTDWTKMSKTLKFCNDSQNCDNKQVYMLYLWMETLYEETYLTKRAGGSVDIASIATVGSKAFDKYFTIMRLEFPPMLYAAELTNYLNSDETQY